VTYFEETSSFVLETLLDAGTYYLSHLNKNKKWSIWKNMRAFMMSCFGSSLVRVRTDPLLECKKTPKNIYFRATLKDINRVRNTNKYHFSIKERAIKYRKTDNLDVEYLDA